MAARLEFYALAEGDKIERHELNNHGTTTPEGMALTGYVSASDADEELLFELLGALADAGTIDARSEGSGTVAAGDVPSLATRLARVDVEDIVDDGVDRATLLAWHETIRASIVATSSALGWRMRYDRGGTTNDGEDEFATAWST